MNIYIEHINTIRRNLGHEELSIESGEVGGDARAYFQELVAELSDEVYNLKKRVEELEHAQ